MYDLYDTRWLHPCFTINLYRYSFICYRDLYCVTLCVKTTNSTTIIIIIFSNIDLIRGYSTEVQLLKKK